MTRRGVALYLVGLALAAALPAFASRLVPAPGAHDRCAQDLSPFHGAPSAEVLDATGDGHLFCSIECAEAWLARANGAPAAVRVREAESGEMLDASRATFVRSRAGATRASGVAVHAFRDPADAERHAQAFRGTLLDGSSRPFRVSHAQ